MYSSLRSCGISSITPKLEKNDSMMFKPKGITNYKIALRSITISNSKKYINNSNETQKYKSIGI